jgi:hypothetical protein
MKRPQLWYLFSTILGVPILYFLGAGPVIRLAMTDTKYEGFARAYWVVIDRVAAFPSFQYVFGHAFDWYLQLWIPAIWSQY